MEYAYAALLVDQAGGELNEENLTAVLEASGCDVVESRVKALVAALEDVDVDEVGPASAGELLPDEEYVGDDGSTVETTNDDSTVETTAGDGSTTPESGERPEGDGDDVNRNDENSDDVNRTDENSDDSGVEGSIDDRSEDAVDGG